jgi:DNA mismatch repair protein MutL
MPILILNDQVVAQIAAGEVIERPSSVIKELVENALDAGASNIRVSVGGGGRHMMRVSDDGHGITTSEVELAFTRHATSKLRTADDLAHIQTLGFRGEALASIASVSHVTVTTRHRDEAAGTQMRLEGGRIETRRSVGAPAGTVITVENLFYNTPARFKFLKAENTEKRQIATVVSRYAMAYPHVRFILEQDEREVFRSSGSGQLADVLVAALGLDTFRDMLEISGQDEPAQIRVYGYTSAPHMHRADRSRIMLFVNGRWVQDTSLSYAVVQAYHTFLMTGRYPAAVLMISVPPEEVDVNVHPTKAEVRFQNPNAIFSVVQRAVRRAIIDLAQTPSMRSTSRAPGNGQWVIPSNDAPHATQIGMNLSLESPGQFPQQRLRHESHHVDEENESTAIPYGPTGPARPRTLPMLRVIGQVGASYIVAEGPAGMYLVDQHAAHERILYEQFMADYAKQGTLAQYTLSTQTIELPAPEARLIEEHLDALQAVGFGLESFGTNTFLIRSVPAMLSDHSPVEVIGGIINELEIGKEPGQEAIEEKIVKRVCKQVAVKAGTVLSHDEMQSIIRQLERCDSPHTCPHGRPTMLHMSSDQLAREFGRK